ncbi:MAG: saccharopine dehydrogenase NADP-binding domain-containing protein, partial [Bacteroidota bacterium]
LMVYGANGYSAQLIIDELIGRGIKPVLAGRNESLVKQLAEKYDYDYKVFDIEDDEKIIAALEGVHTVLNCAGPFKYTAKDLIDGCLSSKTNYIDITGEIPALHLAFRQNEAAKKSGIVILPGAGFDVIPTDCLAKHLSELMPDAVHLKLGFLNKRGKISRGTLLTTLESLAGVGIIRRNGVLLESDIGEFTIKVNTKNFLFRGVSIPWGDVYTSFYSTGIPNVEVYLGLPQLFVQFRALLRFVLKIFTIPTVKNFASNYIKKNFTGPTKMERDSTGTYVWGCVENAKGDMIEEVYQFMEGYNLTAIGASECAERVLKNSLHPGTYTPSLAFGSGFMDLFVIRKIV